MIFIRLPGTSIEVSLSLVKQGAFDLAPKGLTRTNISALEADAYAAGQGCRLLTSDEWDKLLGADIPEVSIGDLYEWTSTMDGDFRVFRGGCWSSPAENARVAYRIRFTPDYRYRDLGFRLVRDV